MAFSTGTMTGALTAGALTTEESTDFTGVSAIVKEETRGLHAKTYLDGRRALQLLDVGDVALGGVLALLPNEVAGSSLFVSVTRKSVVLCCRQRCIN